MLHRKLYLHYRQVREVLTAVVTIGAVLLFSYFTLQGHS